MRTARLLERISNGVIIVSQHRNAALAERKRRELAKKYFAVRLLSRRNGRGRYARNGQYFQWEVFNKPKQKQIELVLHFDYGQSKTKNLIRFQVHVFGPATATDAQAIAAVRKFEKGEEPKGWRWKEIYWAHPKAFIPTGPIEPGSANAEILHAARHGAIGSPDEVTVTRKNSVRTNRRSRGKTKRKKSNA